MFGSLELVTFYWLKREPENEVDKNAVAMTTGSVEVGGHIP